MTTQVLQIFKETALPSTLVANSIYMIAPAANPDYVEMYVTGTSASTVKRIINHDDIALMITNAVQSATELVIVADITARDALTPDHAQFVYVVDATGDSTVTAGGATYLFDPDTTTWVKVNEAESLDVVLSWANIQDKPTSAVADIDDAVSKRHSHSNKTQLDKIDEDVNGNMLYSASLPHTGWDTVGW